MWRLFKEWLATRELEQQPPLPTVDLAKLSLPTTIDEQVTLARSELAELDVRLDQIQQLARQQLLLRQVEVKARRDITDAT